MQLKSWFNENQHGHKSVFDESRLGGSKAATIKDYVAKIYDLVLAEHLLKVHEIAERVGISKDRVCYSLNEILGMRKLSGR